MPGRLAWLVAIANAGDAAWCRASTISPPNDLRSRICGAWEPQRRCVDLDRIVETLGSRRRA